MANMFSGNTTKITPKTLDECTRIDPVSNNLWIWSERLERWGKILFWILIVIGLILTIETGVETHEFLETLEPRDRYELAMSGVKVPSVFGVVFESLLTWGAYASLVYFGLHVSALLVGALASITQNTIISANLALFEAKKNTSAVAAAPSATPMQRPSSPPNTYVNRTPPPSGMWACSYCGTQNKNNYSQCKKCGNYR